MASRVTRHLLLAWAPQPPGRTPPYPPVPCVFLCPYPASVFRTNWKFLTPWSGSMGDPVLTQVWEDLCEGRRTPIIAPQSES